jgi:hypothetical protein
VRQKAGLLVEAGADLYSFVHLTFQEYLAARHIITCSESRGGDTFVWSKLRDRINTSRWNEVTRLLVAARDSEESQRNLVRLILQAAPAAEGIEVCAVLGGLLLDRVLAAEEQRSEILSWIIRSISKNGDGALMLVTMLVALVNRVENAAIFSESLRRASEGLSNKYEWRSLVLAALATSYPEANLVPWLEKLMEDDIVGASLVGALGTYNEKGILSPEVQARWNNLAYLLIEFSYRSPDTNLLAAVACSAFPLNQTSLILAIQLSTLAEYSETRGHSRILRLIFCLFIHTISSRMFGNSSAAIAVLQSRRFKC